MAPEEWYSPAAEMSPVGADAPMAAAPVYELRPLTLGEILDRTFSVYRSRFWLFVGIASLAAALQLFMGVLQVMLQHELRSTGHGMALATRQLVLSLATLAAVCVASMAFSVTQAGTVFALSEVYLGRTTTIGASMRSTVGHWLRYVGIAIWQWWSLCWVMLVLIIPAAILTATGVTGLAVLGGILVFFAILGGLAVGVVLYLRNLLAVPASVVERLPVAASMRRSKQLAVGTKGRIFMVLLISFALYMVEVVLQGPLIWIVAQANLRHTEALWAQAVQLVVNFLGSSLVGPVAMIGLSLVYFDQRVRMEAFDLMVLLGEERAMLDGTEGHGVPAAAVGAAEVAMEAAEMSEAAAEMVAEAPVMETAAAEASATTEVETEAGRPDDTTRL